MPEATAVEPAAKPNRSAEIRRIALATYFGTALEWYDYFIYGTAAALVFPALFFPALDPVIGVIASLVTFALGFVARPVGAVIFGHIGDRLGRRAALIGTVTLMGVATGLIGLLPSYQTIGIAAPIILAVLRLLQGISAGGEWTGAALLAIEHAPPEQRGRYAAVPQLGSPTATLVSSGVFAVLTLLPEEMFQSWVWRVPFLAAFVLLAIALYLRVKVEESPLFRAALAEQKEEKLPVLETIRTAWGRLIIGGAAYLAGTAAFFVLTTFMIGYISKSLKLSSTLALNATLVGAVVEILVIIVAGRLADRIGAAKVCVIGATISVLVAFPVFWLVDTKVPVLVIAGVSLGIGAISIPYGPIGVALSVMFPARLRYSGVALSVGLANILAGFGPLAGTWALGATGGQSWGPALLLALIAFITLVGSAGAHRVSRRAPEWDAV
ncbi:MFS transporter [Saccharopolyspora shandongensis]|uniref:MFS transporter n=1 Tax=Saccharopolyspora shandongensis TaxID=418495 RepID=UPI0033C3201B